jgi:wyosine [tRNA(Phe)-imidazoG37] synthetase (radical SAM superfamily)
MSSTETMCVTMRYTYGPVASWRYGRSLGIDVTTHPKKCTFNCIYCQLGPTRKHVVAPEDVQDALPSSQDILKEVYSVLRRLDLDSIDAVTFSGAGEPTLNLEIGVLADAVQREIQRIPVILLTNASLFPISEVRTNLTGFDIISAKVDAGDDETFRLINHPAKGIFTLDDIIEGIKKLHKKMYGTLALEVMLLRGPKGLTNAEGHARRALIERILEIAPDIIQIYTPWRPSAVEGVQSLSSNMLQEFGQELGEYLTMDKIWVYGFHDARSNPVKWKNHDKIEIEVIDLLKRRPCRVSDITVSMGIRTALAGYILNKLLKNGQVSVQKIEKEYFYRMVQSPKV